MLSCTELSFVTVPETRPSHIPESFAAELFNDWGIGKSQNNGILLFVSKSDRRVEIKMGRGMAALLRMPKSAVSVIQFDPERLFAISVFNFSRHFNRVGELVWVGKAVIK